MVSRNERIAQSIRMGIRRPLSTLTAIVAGGMIVYSLILRVMGNLYLEQLNYIDITTITMVGVLLLRGLWSLRNDSDAQAVSIALIGALSFVFCFEALFKLSFYILPWRMAPPELREFILQVAIALTVLAGFAFHKFQFSGVSRIFAVIFFLGWIFWLAVGFPQVGTGGNYYPPLLDVRLTGPMVYVLNRLIKVTLCMAFYSLYP